MSIERFFTQSIAIKRLTWSNDSSAEVSQDTILGHIQQAGPELTQFIGETLGNVFTIWCDKDEDVDVGDTLTLATGNYAGTYTAKGIQLNAIGNNQHLEIVCVKIIA